MRYELEEHPGLPTHAVLLVHVESQRSNLVSRKRCQLNPRQILFVGEALRKCMPQDHMGVARYAIDVTTGKIFDRGFPHLTR